jgi:hypothetical protein
MSERMPNERLSLLTDPEGGAWTDDDANEVAREAIRARQAESQQQDRIHALEAQQAELLRQAKEKDMALERFETLAPVLASAVERLKSDLREAHATIKVLADALVATAPDSLPCWCATHGAGEQHATFCEARRSALRLVGRLK